MGELAMSASEREAFLAGLHVGILGVERSDGPPLLTPVWYRYTPGGAVEVTTERSTEKARLLEEVGRATLCVQREELPYAYVTVEGPVEVAATDRETRLDIATRYLGDEMGAAYIEQGAVGDDVVLRLRPSRWRTIDFGKSEPPGG